MRGLAPGFDQQYVWPPSSMMDIDHSLCYHSNQNYKSQQTLKLDELVPIRKVLRDLELAYSPTKVVWEGWPKDFEKFLRSSVDWDSSPGWPWKESYPTNRELFQFNGVKCDPVRVAMVEQAVKTRWEQLREQAVSDPIYVFIKPEPHKLSKRDKKAWRLISGVGLTDTLIDRILYGKWLDRMIEKWPEIPSKAGWTPSGGGYRWMARSFRGLQPMSIDKSAWDWTVNGWHADVIENLIPRMIINIDEDWKAVYNNRMKALFRAGYPRIKYQCGCQFVQLVDGIMKSGCLGTISFNSIWQFASHLAVGGRADDVFYSIGDDTVQSTVRNYMEYVEKLGHTGCIVKEIEIGFPIKFAGHEFDEKTCVPSYTSKHMYNLLYLEDKVADSTLNSYQHLYGIDQPGLKVIQNLVLDLLGPEKILSKEYLDDWYNQLE